MDLNGTVDDLACDCVDFDQDESPSVGETDREVPLLSLGVGSLWEFEPRRAPRSHRGRQERLADFGLGVDFEADAFCLRNLNHRDGMSKCVAEKYSLSDGTREPVEVLSVP